MSQAVVALINTLAQVSVILEVMVPLVAVNIPNVPANPVMNGIAHLVHVNYLAIHPINTLVQEPIKPVAPAQLATVSTNLANATTVTPGIAYMELVNQTVIHLTNIPVFHHQATT